MASQSRRLRHLARILAGERKVTAAARAALNTLLAEAARALANAGYSTDVLDNRLPGWRGAVDKDLVPAIEQVFTDAFTAAGRGVVDPEVYATRHLEAVHNRLVGVSDDVFDSMRTTLEDGRRSGESIALLAARVNALLGDDQRWAGRAATIARTEVVSANNAGAAQSAAATAAVLGEDTSLVMKEWLSTSDSRTRETHLALDGSSVMGLESLFDNGLEYPGDPGGDPAEVVNCRCTVLFIYPGDPEYDGALADEAYGGRTTASQALSEAANMPADIPTAPLAPAAVAEVAVDSGPQTAADYSARGLTIQELQDEASSGRGKGKAAARAELRRRGLAASGHTDDALTAEVVALMTRHLTVDEVLAGGIDIDTLVLTNPDGTHAGTFRDFINQEDPVTTTPPEAETPAPTGPLDVPTHAGLAVWAADTERVLMLQRSLDPTDAPDVAGTWEMPGGGLEPGDVEVAAAGLTIAGAPVTLPVALTSADQATTAAAVQDGGVRRIRMPSRARVLPGVDRSGTNTEQDVLTAGRGGQVVQAKAGAVVADAGAVGRVAGVVHDQTVTNGPVRRDVEPAVQVADLPVDGGATVAGGARRPAVQVAAGRTQPHAVGDPGGEEVEGGGGVHDLILPPGVTHVEVALAAAMREFTEETGLAVPAGDITNGWRSDDGVYQGFVLTVATEASAFGELNPDLAAAEAINPDDPQRRNPDVTAWFTLEQVQGLGPALRPEVHNTPWDVFTTPAEEAPVTDTPTDEQVQAALATLSRVAAFASTGTYAPGDPVVPPVSGTNPAPVPPNPANPEDPVPALAQDIAPDGEPFYGIACPEDVMSGDGRLFAAGAITWRDLPLPLMVQDAQMPGHDGAVRAGRLDVLVRDETGPKPMIRYAGVWDTSPVAVEARRQVAAGVARGVSVDCDAVEVQITYTGSDGQPLDPAVDDFPEDGVVNEMETATAARISGLTICSIPAFHQAYIANGVLADRTEAEPGMAEVNGETMPVEVVPEDAVAIAAGAALLLSRDQAGLAPMPAWSLVASAGAIVVPADAFVRPDVLDLHETGTPLTVTADGRVYGHLATWGTCHIGISGLCQEPPASATNYAYFATGSVLTDAGDLQPVGHLTMETGHAGLRLGHHAAVSHYDNTGTAVADVAMGQDHIGIWYAGVVRPGVTEEQVYALRASGKASGDWRPVGGGLELVAALVVNTEGFPVPRPAIAASGGQVQALVAAGMVTTARPVETTHDLHAIAASAVREALGRRDRAQVAVARLAASRAVVRRRRAAVASARLNDRK